MKTYNIKYFSNYDTKTIYNILVELSINTDKIYNVSKDCYKNIISIGTTSFNYNNFLRFIVEVDKNNIIDIEILNK